MLAGERHRAGIVERDVEIVLRRARWRISTRSAPVDEALRQAFVQRIRQAVFDGARQFLPMARDPRPAGSVRGIGPGADLREPPRQRVDIARPPRRGARSGAPSSPRDSTPSSLIRWRKICATRRACSSGVSLRKSGSWQASHNSRTPAGAVRARGCLRRRASIMQRPVIGGWPRLHQPARGRRRIQARQKPVDAGEIESAVAPLQNAHRDRSGGFRPAARFRRRAASASPVTPNVPSFM